MPNVTKNSASRTIRSAALVLAAALAAGCQSMPANNEDLAANVGEQYYQRFPINVEKGSMRLQLPTGQGSHFTAARENEIRKFVARYPSTAAGRLVISTPKGGGRTATAIAARVSHIASQENVRPSAIAHRRHAGGAGSPVIVTYQRYFAVTDQCGSWSKNIAVSGENRPYADLGCSSQHNLAAMADNPRDLVTPRATGPLKGTRNDNVYDKYISGKKTSSSRDSDASGAVSDIAK